MKSSFLLLAFFLFSLLATAQPMDSLSGETFAICFGEGVRVRKSPSLDTPVLGKLPIGGEVRVLRSNVEDPSTWTKLNGVESPWLEIESSEGLRGYVWAGLMAHASVQATLPWEGKPTTLLLGLRTSDGASGWSLRQVAQGKMLREIPLEDVSESSIPSWLTWDDDILEMEVVDVAGFEPPLTLLLITEGICGCGCYSDDSFYVMTEKGLQKAFELHTSDNVEYEGSTYGGWEMQFSEPGVDSPNQIMIDIVSGENVARGDSVESVETTERRVFLWDGFHLKEASK